MIPTATAVPVTGHVHNDDCIILARARVRVLRSEIVMNEAIVAARNDHVDRLMEIMDYIERNVTRVNYAHIIRSMPELRPYFPLVDITDQIANEMNQQNYENNSNQENIDPNTNLPAPGRLRRQ
jgi:hypothetical protein